MRNATVTRADVAAPGGVEDDFGGGASGEDGIEGGSLELVDGELVLRTYSDDAPGKPAPIPWRQPLGGVERALPAGSAPVDFGRCESEVKEILGEAVLGVRVGAT